MSDPGSSRPAEAERFGDYRVLRQLGQGGQGAVYLSESPTGELVAVKVLHPHHAMKEDVQRSFLREVALARRVAAFSTARVIEVGTAGGLPYIVSEYVEGVSLEQRVRERGPLEQGELVRLALGTASALAAIHGAGIVHRDFKPSNVVLGPDGPRVIDFGISRALDSFTATGSGVSGTPSYMAPEQIANEPPGPPADIFSWAITMVFATGRPAFGGTNVPALLHAILTAEPDLSAVPEQLRPLLVQCLDKSPQARPTAADIMLRLVGHQTASAPAAGDTPLQTPPTQDVPLQGAPTQATERQGMPSKPRRPEPESVADRPHPVIERDPASPPPSGRTAVRVVVPGLIALLAVAVAGAVLLWTTRSGSTSPSSSPSDSPRSLSAVVNNLAKVGVAYDVGGRGDLWFNDSAALGLDRAKRELGVRDLKELAAKPGDTDTEAKKEQRLRSLATDGYNPIIAIGYGYTEAVDKVAAEFPDVRFAIVDSYVHGNNISSLYFAEQEGGFLAGSAAALATKKGTIGFIGAVSGEDAIERALVGFKAGAKAVRADISIDVKFLTRPPDYGGYADPAKGKSVATEMFNRDVDVVFQAAGGSNLGITQAAQRAGGLVVGAEGDEYRTSSPELQGTVLTSVIKRIDNAVFHFLKSYAAGTAKPGPIIYGLKDAGIDYTTSGGRIDPYKKRLDVYKQKIVDGQIVVPSS